MLHKRTQAEDEHLANTGLYQGGSNDYKI